MRYAVRAMLAGAAEAVRVLALPGECCALVRAVVVAPQAAGSDYWSIREHMLRLEDPDVLEHQE